MKNALGIKKATKRAATLKLHNLRCRKHGTLYIKHLKNGWAEHIVSCGQSDVSSQDRLPTEAKQGWAGQYLDGRPPGKTRLLLEEVLVRPTGGTLQVFTLQSVWVLMAQYSDGDTIL